MKNIKKLINNYYNHNYDHDTDIDLIKDKADISKKRNGGLLLFMKTKKLAILSTAVFIAVIGAIVIGCSLNNNNKQQETVKDTVITLDLNPSIQITVDENGNVSSVYGNNDEGKMIIIDIQNELVGKKYDYALDLIIEADTECGFFVKATSNEEYNNLKITIDTEASEQQINAIEQEIKTHVEEKLTELDVIIKDKITTVKNNTKDALINKLLELDSTYTKDELQEKSNEELINLIAAYHIERINFPTEDLVEMYNNFKEYEINIAESRIFQNFVTTSSALNEAIINQYNNLYNLAQQALNQLKTTYEQVFINEDSDYVKAYNKLLEAKAEVLSLRSEVEALEDGLEKTLKQAQLSTKETALLSAQSAL